MEFEEIIIETEEIKEIFNKLYVNKLLFIHTKTAEDAEELILFASMFSNINPEVWNSNNTRWDLHKEKTLYVLQKIGIANLDTINKDNIQIIEYNKGDFMKEVVKHKISEIESIANTSVEWLKSFLKGEFYAKVENPVDKLKFIEMLSKNNIKIHKSCFLDNPVFFYHHSHINIVIGFPANYNLETFEKIYSFQELQDGSYKNKKENKKIININNNHLNKDIYISIENNTISTGMKYYMNEYIGKANYSSDNKLDIEAGFCMAFAKMLLGEDYKQIIEQVKDIKGE